MTTRVLVSLGALAVVAGARLEAQRADSGAAPRLVAGRVMLGSASGERPLPNQVVVLHRIAADSSGPADSATTGQDGRFRLSYTPTGDAVYLLSARRGGVAYFAAAEPRSDDPRAADIVVFDTTSRPVPVSLHGRHVIISAPDNRGTRAVVEVFELSNDSAVTKVGGGDGAPVWEVKLPELASRPRVGEGDVAAAAVTFANGRARLFAPLQPGLRQVVLAYELPAAAFPQAISLESPTSVLEVLLEELSGTVSGAGLSPQEPVTVSGRRFNRFLAQEAPRGAVVQVVLPAARSTPSSGGQSAPWLVPAFAALVSLAAALWLARRRPGDTSALAPTRAPNDSVSLARDIAALDAVFRDGIPAVAPAQGTAGAAALDAYRAQRARLSARLVDALAAERAR